MIMEIELKYENGDVFHCYNGGILSRLIRFFTKSSISHTAMFLEIWGQPYIIDAQNDGVNVRPFDEWLKMYNYKFIVHRFGGEFTDRKQIAIRALSKSGNTAYDFKGLLLKHPWKLITGSYKKERNETERMYCSEFVAWVFSIETAYRMTPKDLFEFCEHNNDIFKRIN